MKKVIWACLAVSPFLALPARADAWGTLPPVRVDGGCNLNFSVGVGGHPVQLGPWYLYFPYEAHFAMPAPVMPYPNYHGPMTLPPPPMPRPPQQAIPHQGATSHPVQRTNLQPVSYQWGQAPSYWYGY
jgi:hypothetical protein